MNPSGFKWNLAEEVSVSEQTRSSPHYRRRDEGLELLLLLKEKNEEEEEEEEHMTWDWNSRGAESDGGAEDEAESCHDTGSGSGGWQEHWATDRLSGCAWASDEYTLQRGLEVGRDPPLPPFQPPSSPSKRNLQVAASVLCFLEERSRDGQAGRLALKRYRAEQDSVTAAVWALLFSNTDFIRWARQRDESRLPAGFLFRGISKAAVVQMFQF